GCRRVMARNWAGVNLNVAGLSTRNAMVRSATSLLSLSFVRNVGQSATAVLIFPPLARVNAEWCRWHIAPASAQLMSQDSQLNLILCSLPMLVPMRQHLNRSFVPVVETTIIQPTHGQIALLD